jgi:anti-anti-sigma factor
MFSADLSTRRFNGCTMVTLRGELDLADAAAVTAALTAVAARDPVIIVDLAGLEFIDSSGVAALARGRTQALPARHSSGPPSGPDPATCRLSLVPAAAGPEA